MDKTRRRLNLGPSNKFKRSNINHQSASDVLRKKSYNNGNSGSSLFVKRKPTTSIPIIVRSKSTSTSSGFITAVTASSITPLTETNFTDGNSQTSYGDTSIFLVIGLIVGITIIGCILACLYRRRRVQRLIAIRSLRNTSVGSKIVMNRTVERKSQSPTPMTEHPPKDSMTMNNNIGTIPDSKGNNNIGAIPDSKGEPLNSSPFSTMKLPPTTALPPLPPEAQLSSLSKNFEREKSLNRSASLPKFNCPPPPGHAPNSRTTHHSTATTATATSSTSKSISPTLNDSYVASPSKCDVNDLSPSPASPTTSEIFASYWPMPPQTHYNDGKTTGDEDDYIAVDDNRISLPKVEKISTKLSINFEQLDIFKDKTTPSEEYPVDKNDGMGKLPKLGDNKTTKDGKENVEVIIIDNGTEKLYNEYI